MLIPAPPLSNLERQRLFQQSHPGYFRKYHARRKAIRKGAKARRAELIAAARAEAVEAKTAPRQPLMLPAPAVIPVIPGMNTLAEMPALAPRPIAQPAPPPAERSLAA